MYFVSPNATSTSYDGTTIFVAVLCLAGAAISIWLLVTLFSRLKQISENTKKANQQNEQIIKYLKAVCNNQVAAFERTQKNKPKSTAENEEKHNKNP